LKRPRRGVENSGKSLFINSSEVISMINELCILTESVFLLSAGLFALAGLYQMTMWAIGKHKLYKKEFPNYPKGRKAILPFLI